MDYVIMRFALMEDVRLIIGNNAGRMEQLVTLAKENSQAIIEDIRNGTINSKFPLSEKTGPTYSRTYDLIRKKLHNWR